MLSRVPATDDGLTAIDCPQRWADLTARAGPVPLQQAWDYGAALQSTGATVRRLLANDDRQAPLAVLQCVTRRPVVGVDIGFVTGGPLWLAQTGQPDPFPWQRLRRHRRWWCGRPLLMTPAISLEASGAIALQKAGWRRVMTGYSTAWLDLLTRDDALLSRAHGKWRNALRQGWRSQISVTERAGALPWLLEQHRRHRKEAGFEGPPIAFLARMLRSMTRPPLLLAAGDGVTPLAAMLFVRHGLSATYLIGWGGEESRRLRSHHVLLWEAMRRLRATGIRWLDLGGLNTERAPGIARFKLGTGAVPLIYAGTFV